MRADQPTRFSEANAFLAISTDKDYAEARAILSDYSASELRALENAADGLGELCCTMLAEMEE